MPMLPPRGRHRLLRLFGVGGRENGPWLDSVRPIRMLWDRNIKAWIRCDLREWGGRWHYYCRQYYDTLLPLILRKYLKSGDTFVDIGANLGVHTLLASRIVGGDGRVLAIEPHPVTCSLLKAHLAINGCVNVRALQVGLGSVPRTAILTMPDNHPGTATMRNVVMKPTGNSVSIPIETGDSLLKSISAEGDVFVKIDVEGLELAVLQGCKDFLTNQKPKWIYVEISPDWLEQQGGSAEELLGFLAGYGYIPAVPRLTFESVFWPKLTTSPLSGVPDKQQDILFTYSDENNAGLTR